LKPEKLPRIWLIQDIGQPFVWGLLRGSVYLPVDFLDLDGPERCRTILAHELSHVARFDAAINLLQVLAQAIYWFHPFVWWTNRKIRQEREKCCDEMTVAQFGTSPEHYTGAIVEALAVERRLARPIPSLAIVGSLKDIEERIRTMMRPGKKFYERPSLIAVLIVLLLALLTVPTALVLTAEAQEKTTATPPLAPTAKAKAAATSALFRAIRDTNIERMRLAINQGADLEGENKDSIWLHGDIQSIGCTPLYVATGVISSKNNLMIELLLEAGANPNTRGPDGQIPLHAVARGSKISRVELLVSGGSDVNAADKKGRTPAIIAFELGHADTFDLMVGKGATVSTDLMSAYKGNLSRVKSLIENGKAQERFEQGLTLLHAAAAGGHTTIVDSLLTNGLDVRSKTQEGYTALHYAAVGNHREVAELLHAKGANVNSEPGEQTPLHWAIREQHKDMIGWLLARGANPNADGGDYWGTPLHWAVWWWDVETALLLVSHGGDINLKTQKFPYSPLFDAVLKGNRAMVEALITKTGDTAAAKWAPLQATVASGDRQAIEDLLDKGADVNAKDELGGITLHMATLKGHKDIAELLITRGADVDAKSGKGSTPLHGAAKHGHKALAELLLTKGADVNAKTGEGKTPLSLAKDKGHTEIVKLLRKHGAEE
ncbi:ankyrin repeat domain-containing protein, partial [Planctomycetota bacterium]